MRFLITGISGFVGEHLAKEICMQCPDADIFGLERAIKPFELYPELNKKIKIISSDITDAKTIERNIQKIAPDIVFHLAGFASASGTDREMIFKVNVIGTLNIIKSLSRLSKRIKVIIVSTSYVYGNTPRRAKESDILSPIGIYAESKLEMEKKALEFAKNFQNVELIIARSVNHAGPGQRIGFVVPDFASQIAKLGNNDEIHVGNVQAKRDFLDVRDVVRAYIILSKSGKKFNVYNVSSGKSVAIKNILAKLIKISEKNIAIRKDPNKMRASEINVNCLDNAKIKKLGWKIAYGIDDTLKETYVYWRNKINENCN